MARVSPPVVKERPYADPHPSKYTPHQGSREKQRRRLRGLPAPEPLDPRRALPEGLRYYAITTVPKREFHVARFLEDHGAFTIVPLVYHRLGSGKWRGSKRAIKRGKVEMPLIPRIVVAGMNLPPSATALAEVNPHITGVLGVNGEPMPMRVGEPERLRDISADLMKPVPLYVPGSRVKVPLAGYGGGVVEISRLQGKWAYYLQSMFGAEREVGIEMDRLEAA